MSFRVILALTFSAALIVACVLLYPSNPPAALSVLVAACTGALAARLLTSGVPESVAPERNRDGDTVTGRQRADSSDLSPAAGVSTEIPAGALLEVTMDSMREGVLVVDSEMRVMASNGSALAIFARNAGDGASIRSRRLSELTRNPAIYSAFAAAVARGERSEVKVQTADAERRVFDLHVAPLKQKGFEPYNEVRGAVGVFFDITRLERLERVRQEFLSNVSHELRTPLTAILTFVETLDEGAIDDPENNRRFLSIIRRNSERMHNLINDILELSAIEAGTVTVKPAPVRLSMLVGECMTALAGRAAERHVELRNEVGADVEVFADSRRLEQMLTNLVDNAVKFNAERCAVTVAHERAEGRDRIHVTDCGEGIAPEHIERIFERFYRVDLARSRSLGGTGLGLAIVKHLARAHGGEAGVRSTPGTGSTFTIELPAKAEA